MNGKKNREPMVIALATGKGGSMKTTSAVFLACALVDQSRGEQRVLVADADVQGDAKDWCTGRRAGRPAAVRRDVRRAGRHQRTCTGSTAVSTTPSTGC